MTTIRDVAKRAGVSTSTVSRVLNKSCPVSSDKRERVEEAARVLGYSPDPTARSLLLRKTGVLGVVLPFATGEFFSEFLSGVDEVTSRNEYVLLISISHRRDEDLTRAISNLYRRVDGMLVWAPEVHASDVLALVGDRTPVVFLNSKVAIDDIDHISFDNFGGMYQIASHLVQLGHRDIAFIKGPPRSADAHMRNEAYRAALRDSGIPLRGELEIEGEYSVEAGYEAVPRILSLSPRPTAIMAPNDQSAFGVLRALHEAGVDVPGEISVSGFDDIPHARYTTPALTTARVQVRPLGELAMETLVSRINGRASFVNEKMGVDLVVRGSSAPPPAR